MSAMQSSREAMGEESSMPRGASCNVSPDGSVTIMDPFGRRTFLLTPTEPGSEIVDSIPPAKDGEQQPILIRSRDEEPSEGNPLIYRERMYAASRDIAPRFAERMATQRLRKFQKELRGRAEPKFVHVAVFDHEWTDHPERPPVACLQWKDWRSSVDIDFPLEDSLRDSAPRTLPPPPAEERMSYAFEACRDLLFLRNRAEALEFTVRLLSELVPSEAATATVYDIDNDVFRIVAARGPNADDRRGKSIKAGTGLYGAASTLPSKAVLELQHAPQDKRFDHDVDAIPGLDISSVLYEPLVHDGRLYGMVQLANGKKGKAFEQPDVDVLRYVGEQVSAFIARGPSIPPPAPEA